MLNAERSYVVCHMMSTIEGKITSGTGVDILEDYFTLYTKLEDRLKAKSWLFGRVTMQMFADNLDLPLPQSNKKINNDDFVAPTQSGFYIFGVDTKGLLRWKSNTISLSNVTETINLIIVVTDQTPKDYLAYLQEKNISYVFAGESEIDFNILLSKTKQQFGVEKILLEGGGILNGSIMTQDFVDEISLLVTPIVINSSIAPSVFERKTENVVEIKKYSLFDIEKIEDDTVWLRYKRSK